MRLRLLAGDTQHLRLRRAIDVGIENTDAGAFLGQRQGQVDRRRALADAALAGGHGDDVLDARHQLDAELHRMGNDLAEDVGRHIADARQGAHGGDHLLADGVDLRLGRIAEFDVEGNVAAIDPDVLEGLAGNEILARIGIDRSRQRGLDLLFSKTHENSGLR